jgi:protein involved in ribonucleotide reduction
MKLVYASRKGHVQQLVDRLGATDVLKIETGAEKVDGDYIIVTYTDGAGIVPPTVEQFIEANKAGFKAAAVSGNSERHPDTFCKAADVLKENYGVPIISTFEDEGDASVDEAIKPYL